MNTGRTIFSEVMDFLPLGDFRKCVARYRGQYKVQKFSCMAFARLTYRESLRDNEACPRAMQRRLYHMGIRERVSRSTLSDANENRDWRIYADFAFFLFPPWPGACMPARYPGMEFGSAVYALDSTTMELSLSLFRWAPFRRTRGAIKPHTPLNLQILSVTVFENTPFTGLLSRDI